MSDIVKTLRYWALPPAGETREPENAALLKWAADEIELLQMQLKMQPLPEYRDDPRLYEIIEGQRAEIERLREENSTLSDSLAAKADRIDRLGETVVRLRGLLADAPCTCPNSPPWDWPHDSHNEDCYLNRVREALGE